MPQSTTLIGPSLLFAQEPGTELVPNNLRLAKHRKVAGLIDKEKNVRLL